MQMDVKSMERITYVVRIKKLLSAFDYNPLIVI